MTEELVEVKREFRFTPLKLVAVVAGVINAILLIASIAGNPWLYEDPLKKNEGLWSTCEAGDKNCAGWLSAVQAMMILALLLNIAATALAAWSYFINFETYTKWIYYRIATGLYGGALLFAIIGLSVYIGMTLSLLKYRVKGEWHVGWGHGLGWSSVIVLVVIIVLLVLPTEDDTARKAPKRAVNYYDNAGHM